MAKSAVKPSVGKNDALLWTVLLFGAIMGSYLIYGLMDPMGDFGRCCPDWRAWTPILEQWELLPTFLFIEYGAILFTMGTLVHAYQSGPEYLLVWLSSFLTGSANGAVPFASHGHALAAVSVGVQGATPLVCRYILHGDRHGQLLASARDHHVDAAPTAVHPVHVQRVYVPRCCRLLAAQHIATRPSSTGWSSRRDHLRTIRHRRDQVPLVDMGRGRPCDPFQVRAPDSNPVDPSVAP